MRLLVTSIFVLTFFKSLILAQCTWQPSEINDFNVLAGSGGYINFVIHPITNLPLVVYQDPLNANKASVKINTGTSWNYLGSAGFSSGQADFTSIAIDNVGTPYVAYVDVTNSSKATVMKYNGTAWVAVGIIGFSTGQVSNISIKMNPASNLPYVVFKDAANGNKITVMSFNGTNWINVGSAGFSAGTVTFPALAINSSGIPFIIFSDASISNKAVVMTYSAGIWSNVGTGTISSGQTTQNSIAIDPLGNPVVTFYESSAFPQTAKVYKFNNGNWTNIIIPTGPGTITNMNLTVDNIGNIYVIEFEQGFNGSIYKYNGVSWTNWSTFYTNIAPSLSNCSVLTDNTNIPYVVFTESGGASTNGSMFCKKLVSNAWQNIYPYGISGETISSLYADNDQNNNLYVFYRENNFPSIGNAKKYNGTNWTSLGTNSISSNPTLKLDIAVDKNSGVPYICYVDPIISNKLTVKSFTGSTWNSTSNISFSTNVGSGNYDLAIHVNGEPYLLFEDANNANKISVIKYSNGSWSLVGNPGFTTGTARYPIITFDKNNIPYILYTDIANSNNLVIMKLNGGTWTNIGNTNITAYLGFENDLEFDNTNNPVVAYRSGASGNNLNVAKFNGVSWNQVGATINTNQMFSTFDKPEMAIDASGAIYLSYCDVNNVKKLEVRKFDGTNWVILGQTPFISLESTAISKFLMNGYTASVVYYSKGTAYAKIFSNNPQASASSNAVCLGSLISLNASGGTNYSWAGPQSYNSTTATNTIFVSSMLQSGNYSVTINDPNCGTSVLTVSITAANCTTINELNDLAQLTIYPNPVKNILTLNSSTNIEEVVIYNLIGERLVYFKMNSNQNTINLDELKSGIYLIELKSSSNSRKIKFVKE